LKVKNNILFEFLTHGIRDMYYVFLALLIGVGFHELGHYITAAYYKLNPKLGVSSKGLFVLTDSAPRYIEEIVTNSGVIANLLVVFVLFIIFFIREKKCKKHHLPCFFIFLVIMSNLLIALVTLILFPFVLSKLPIIKIPVTLLILISSIIILLKIISMGIKKIHKEENLKKEKINKQQKHIKKQNKDREELKKLIKHIKKHV